MAIAPMTELPPSLLDDMGDHRLHLMVSRDADTGEAYVSSLSWLVALDGTAVTVALDQRSRTLANLRVNPGIQLILLGGGGCYVALGQAHITEERMAGVSLPVVRVEVRVNAVRNALHFGARLIGPPQTEATYDADQAARLDEQIFTALGRKVNVE